VLFGIERLKGEPGGETILGDLVKNGETRNGKLEGPAYIRGFVNN
jgi:hypothetical protein